MTSKPTFYFFKMIGCPACVRFNEYFQRLVQDPEVRQAVGLEMIEFGQGYSLSDEFPDFQEKIKYAPFLWLARSYDESTGYHLQPETMTDKSLNTRQDGQEYHMEEDPSYEGLKSWILKKSQSSGNQQFRGRRK